MGMRSSGLRKGVTTWLVHNEERTEMLAHMEEAAGTFRNLALSKCWNSWLGRLSGPEDNPATRAARHFRNISLARSLLTWIEETGRWLVMLNALGGMRKREVRDAINGSYTILLHC